MSHAIAIRAIVLRFSKSSLQICGPIDIVLNVSGPPIVSIDGYTYCVIFVNYFENYLWSCPCILNQISIQYVVDLS